MTWSKQLCQLRDALSMMIPFREDTLSYLTEAGINWRNVAMPNNALTLWHNIISYADENGQLTDLVRVMVESFPQNPYLISYRDNIHYSLGPDLASLGWRSPVEKEALEKLTGSTSTLLPIQFLQKGVQKARSVARILIRREKGTEAGTGFLLPNNLLITNHHVIGDAATAGIASIQFNYEQSLNGTTITPVEFALDPASGFATSEASDWTAVRIMGDANKDFGALTLEPVQVSRNEFVNIIQHPGGQFKQIAMYHNMVTYADSDVVQYLTDTEPGSSGSPVFNSEWKVVALHHSGGMLREPGTSKNLVRNEGIHINQVIEGIRQYQL
ncbi:MAG: trypsin-like peptidase domain-containing protein [Bacteroidetes bacterium]|nr:trypsin-like peptidase domain-containing protein [Bacteroidota bacterium]